MARKNYTEEFRRQAVDLYRSTPGATLRGIAADLGISRGTLQVWVHALDPDSSSPSSDAPATQGQRAGRAGSAEAELAQLRAPVAALETENAELLIEQTKLATAAESRCGVIGARDQSSAALTALAADPELPNRFAPRPSAVLAPHWATPPVPGGSCTAPIKVRRPNSHCCTTLDRICFPG